MDLELRGWVMLGSTVVMIGVVAHAIWVRWRGQRDLALDIEPVPTAAEGRQVDDLDLLRAELPNGGSRPVPRARQPVAEQGVPVLVAPVTRRGRSDSRAGRPRELPSVGGDDVERSIDVSAPGAGQPAQAPSAVAHAAAAAVPAATAAARQPAPRATNGQAAKAPEVIVINVMSRRVDDDGFPGRRLLDVVTARGLRFGDMNIFHRFVDGRPSTANKAFSMACAVKPGTFDLSTLDETSVPGVSLFLQLENVADPLPVFEDMLEVARHIASELDGDLFDERRSAMTAQTIEHLRERIRDYTRRNGR
jgi:cell division protein ZipA